jgi:hypothetical protein
VAFDYSEMVALALELVTEFGREVTLIELAESVSDPTQPWLGNTAPRTTPAAELTVMAVFVEPSRLDDLGTSALGEDFLRRVSQIAIIASTEDLDDFDEILDSDSSRWRVERVSSLKPGPVNLLHYLGLNR